MSPFEAKKLHALHYTSPLPGKTVFFDFILDLKLLFTVVIKMVGATIKRRVLALRPRIIAAPFFPSIQNRK